MAEPSAPHDDIPAARIVGCSLLHQVLVSAIAASVPVVMPELTRSAGLFEGLAGLYAMMMYVGAIGATLAGETIFRRLGAATASAVACILAAVGLLGVLPLSLTTFAAAAFVIGLGYGPVAPASSHMMARIVGRADLNFIFSVRQAGAPLGVLGTGLVLPLLVAWLGWQRALVVMAAAVTVVALATLRFVRRFDALQPPAYRGGAGILGPVREVIGDPKLKTLVATSFLFSSMLATLNAFVPTVVSALGGLDLARAGLCAAVAQASAIGGRLCWGVVADRVLTPQRTLAVMGFLMAGASLALGTIDPGYGFTTILAICAWLGATAGGWGGVVLAQSARLAPPGRVGRAASGVMVLNYLGVMLGPPLVGLVLALTDSFFVALASVAAVGATGGAIALLRR
ncbi:MAG: MFS transporter [Alphaproteobacteria bacterium]|nr:MFS transporter [Alphaproteobacteria bacterium]